MRVVILSPGHDYWRLSNFVTSEIIYGTKMKLRELFFFHTACSLFPPPPKDYPLDLFVALCAVRFIIKKNSTFCPQSAFYRFVQIWEETENISLNCIKENSLVGLITHTACVYYAVRIEFLNKIQVGRGVERVNQGGFSKHFGQSLAVINIPGLRLFQYRRVSAEMHKSRASRPGECILYGQSFNR